MLLGVLGQSVRDFFGLSYVPKFGLGRKVIVGWCV